MNSQELKIKLNRIQERKRKRLLASDAIDICAWEVGFLWQILTSANNPALEGFVRIDGGSVQTGRFRPDASYVLGTVRYWHDHWVCNVDVGRGTACWETQQNRLFSIKLNSNPEVRRKLVARGLIRSVRAYYLHLFDQEVRNVLREEIDLLT